MSLLILLTKRTINSELLIEHYLEGVQVRLEREKLTLLFEF